VPRRVLHLDIRYDAPQGHLVHRGLDRRALRGEHQDARGRVRELQPVEAAVVLERLEVELGQHRVERVLDRPGVTTGRRRADLVALVEPDLRARLGQERRGRAADDAAADDGDVRGGAHSPLA